MVVMDIQVTGVLGFLWLCVVIWAIIQVAGSPGSGLAKLVWILLLLFLPVFGVIIWFLFGPKAPKGP
jgi:hypothetical protein